MPNDVPSILRGWPRTNVHRAYDVEAARDRLRSGALDAERERAAALARQVGYRLVRVRDDELPYFVADERERLRRREVEQMEDKQREKGEPAEKVVDETTNESGAAETPAETPTEKPTRDDDGGE